MKKLIALAAMLTAVHANASDWITSPLGSFHFERRQSNGERWQERNAGFGYNHEFNEDIALIAGTYKNSFNRQTSYVGGRYTPLHLYGVSIGFAIAAATGYRSPVVAMTTARYDYSGIGIELIGAPAAGKGSSSFVGAQLRVRIDDWFN